MPAAGQADDDVGAQAAGVLLEGQRGAAVDRDDDLPGRLPFAQVGDGAAGVLARTAVEHVRHGDELQRRYSVFPPLEGAHMHCAFGHLDGYSSGYYTYMWSLVIANDMFSAFDKADLFDPEVAGAYRDKVLVPGGRRDAADLVEDFLRRPYTFEAYAAWLAE